MEQIVQILGAVLILVAFAGAQVGAMTVTSRVYLVLNFVGSLILAVLAWRGRQWGFFLLEGVWSLVSLYGLVQSLRGRRAPTAH